MDEEAGNRHIERRTPDVDGVRGSGGVEGNDVPVMEWVDGLPSSDDLIPLSQWIVPPELATAFSIPLPGVQTMLDVQRAAQKSISNFTRNHNKSSSSPPAISLEPFSSADTHAEDTIFLEDEVHKELSTPPKLARSWDHEDGSSGAMLMEALECDPSSIPAENSFEDNSGRTLKRTRLVWTPQLHKRFVDVVAHLGIKNAVPKTIMQLMNVDGLTRENVASHLQKYRLYLKRVQGFSNEGPLSTDHLFASTPAPQSLQEQQMPMPMSFTVPAVIPMPVYNLPNQHSHGLVPVNNHQSGQLYNVFDSHHLDAPTDWLGGNKFASIISYPHVSSSGK